MIPAGTIIYASADCPEAIDEARAHAKRMALTTEDCRMVRRSGQVLLELRKAWQTQRQA